jgi:hypothetical protein
MTANFGHWSTPYPDRARATGLNDRLKDRLAAMGWDVHQLEEDLRVHMFQHLVPGQLRRWLDTDQRWDPTVLYEVCRKIDYPMWEAANAIGVLPGDLEDLIDPRVMAGSLVSVDHYLERKREARESGEAANAPQAAAVIADVLAKQLEGRYRIERYEIERGKKNRQPYHTYLALFPEPPDASSLEDDRALRMAVSDVLGSHPAHAHWERSEELKPSKDATVLIVETTFDNRPSGRYPQQRWCDLAPIALVGVYYSGAKDIGVLLARESGLAAFDTGKYVGEVLRDASPFRQELRLQHALFWSLMEDPGRRAIIMSVDDYAALTTLPAPESSRRSWPRTRQLDATAVVLRMEPKLLDYAAFHVARARRASETAALRRRLDNGGGDAEVARAAVDSASQFLRDLRSRGPATPVSSALKAVSEELVDLGHREPTVDLWSRLERVGHDLTVLSALTDAPSVRRELKTADDELAGLASRHFKNVHTFTVPLPQHLSADALGAYMDCPDDLFDAYVDTKNKILDELSA